MNCLCDYDAGDEPEFWSASIRTARNPYGCCECHAVIQPGDKYEYVSGKWDGDISVFRTCITCAAVRVGQMSSWVYGHLREDLWDCLGLDYITGEIDDWAEEEGENR